LKDMYSDRLSSLVNHICHVWEDEMAENDAKIRAALNSMSQEHDLELFNMQKAFKSAMASKNNEINDLITECKRLKYLLSQYGAEHKEMQRKLDDAYRTIDSLKGHGDDASDHGSVHSASKSVKNVEDASYLKDTGSYASHLQRQQQASHGSFDRNKDPNAPHRGEMDGMHAYRQYGSSGSFGSVNDLGGSVFSPPTAPMSAPYGGKLPIAISLPTAGQQKAAAAPSNSESGSNGLVFGGRFVVDGDKDGNIFVGNASSVVSRGASTEPSPTALLSSPDHAMLEPPPGFGGLGSPSPSNPSTRTKSRLALVDDSDSESAPVPAEAAPADSTSPANADGEAGAILNSIRLQSKSSKLDARPAGSPVTSNPSPSK
jgi:hypothetical protein